MAGISTAVAGAAATAPLLVEHSPEIARDPASWVGENQRWQPEGAPVAPGSGKQI